MDNKIHQKRAWVTLVTRETYLAGVIALAYTLLEKHRSAYPLIVLITPSLPEDCLEPLRSTFWKTRLQVHGVQPLLPPASSAPVSGVADRFADTYTKLRAFGLLDYDRCVFVDADMVILNQSPDAIFDTKLPAKDWIAATHACVCNLDSDAWAPKDWTKANCAYSQPVARENKGTPILASSPETHHLLNSGLFVYEPNLEGWNEMMDKFNTSDQVPHYKLPDQDFLTDFYRNKWLPLPWSWNAIKTMRYWHPKLWVDENVHILHYIVDKPWNRRLASDGIAGHLGRDGVTHQWWWNIWTEICSQAPEDLTGVAKGYLARPLDEDSDRVQVQENLKYDVSGKMLATKPLGKPPATDLDAVRVQGLEASLP